MWEIHVADPSQRFEYEGMPVRAGDPIVLKHRGTNEKMAALKSFTHSTDFGEEYEVPPIPSSSCPPAPSCVVTGSGPRAHGCVSELDVVSGVWVYHNHRRQAGGVAPRG